jgi:hypothetical protein
MQVVHELRLFTNEADVVSHCSSCADPTELELQVYQASNWLFKKCRASIRDEAGMRIDRTVGHFD